MAAIERKRAALISDSALQQVTIGERKPHNNKITLLEYSEQWPVLFRKETERIRFALNKKVIQLEHVGSTSVPGLCAKPIIDILLVVKDSANEQEYVPALEKAGYRLRIREPNWFEHRMFKGPDTDINLHVFSEGVSEIDRTLTFRNWLRTHPEDREFYARTKRKLAQKKWRHIQHYAEAKNPVIQKILAKAFKH